MKRLEQHPEVEDEIQSWALILAERSDRVPFEFLRAVREGLQHVRKYPERSHFVYKRFRRHNMKRFSHSIIYREERDAVYVIAVMHQRRNPDYWKSRADESEA
ncbi:MAG: type II toxin-antitoxin system RelE/ParE family toxin [Verrucomicrobiaceae bacterium]|nr:type II toxin-antitoxin system RelE/ParE family toxin [Verrucomicrobiaceae bacterium]